MAQLNLKPGSRGVVILIAVAVVIFIGGVLEYAGMSAKLGTAREELKTKLEKVSQSKEIAQKRDQAKLNYDDTVSQLGFLEASVSSEAYVPTLLKQIEKLAKTTNLKVKSIAPEESASKEMTRTAGSGRQAAEGNIDAASQEKSNDADKSKKKEEKPYRELNIKLEFAGKYSNVLEFIHNLNSFPKIMAVKDVSIQPKDTQMAIQSSPMLQVKMQVTAYVLKPEDTSQDPGSKTKSQATGSAEADKGRPKNEVG